MQRVEGSVSERAQLQLNGNPVSIDDEGRFLFELALGEGEDALVFKAVDAAGNESELAITVLVDTRPPAAPEASAISISRSVDGRVSVSGSSGSIEPSALVFITNLRSGEALTTPATDTGSFGAELGALALDSIQIAARDMAGNTGPEAVLTVPAPPSPAAEAIPEGSFGAAYRSLVPQNATLPEYSPTRLSLVTGQIRDASGSPLAGATISILSHPEYGTTATDAQGAFTIPVEGGGYLTVACAMEGFITSHRQVHAPWNDIAVVEPFSLTRTDTASTRVIFDNNPSHYQTHQSTEVVDSFGARSCTLVFRGNNRASSVDAEGNEIGSLGQITVRATEFTTPELMPARLPPSSAFTYCVEIQVDGVQRVRFKDPVVIYVDNFLGFRAGETVPVGYYDQDRGVWVPSDNGIVVKLLDTNGDGVVDALDAGSGRPADLNKNGSYTDEAMGLQDSSKYRAGATYWRFEVRHFTSWDSNWGFNPPGDAQEPRAQCKIGGKDLKSGDCSRSNASFVEERSRILHEDIPVPGTDLMLHYSSSRVRGYGHGIGILASGSTTPASLKRIVVQARIAGRTFEKILDPLPNQEAEIFWDGLDHLGIPMTGKVPMHVRIGYCYDGAYSYTSRFGYNGNGYAITGSRTRREVTLWQSINESIDVDRFAGTLAEGWTISSHHYLNPQDLGTLHRGDGLSVTNNASIISRVDDEALTYLLEAASGLAVNSRGDLFILDFANNAVYMIESDSNVFGYHEHRIIVDSGGSYVYSGEEDELFEDDEEGIPFTPLNGPLGIAVDLRDDLYILDAGNYRVLKVDMKTGSITTVAGNGSKGEGGTGGPAVQAQLSNPSSIAVDAAGNLYISDYSGDEIPDSHAGHGIFHVHRVDTSGMMTTVFNLEYECWNTASSHCGPIGNLPVAVDSEGNLYAAYTRGNWVFKINTSGVRKDILPFRLEGRGEEFSGDGGPAANATVNRPSGLAVDAAGNLYIADSGNHRIRKVDTLGIITTVAGGGQSHVSGWEGVEATRAELDYPSAIALDAAGSLYFANSPGGAVIYKAHSNARPLAEGSVIAEERGVGHVMSSTGVHRKTIDLSTGQVLLSFDYDQSGALSSIADRFNSRIVMERDGSGRPTAIVSGGGVRTGLALDAAGHLTRISYPDGGHYDFEYTSGGLLRFKTEPNGSRYEHRFDEESGVLTDALDEEGGSWHYESSMQPGGDMLTLVTAAEGSTTSYLDHRDSTGAYTSHIIDPGGSEAFFSRSADGLSSAKTLACGMSLTFGYALDPMYNFLSLSQSTEKTFSGLTRTTLRERAYEDTNKDGLIEKLVEKVTLNGKSSTFSLDTAQSTKLFTSAGGRSRLLSYDPSSLLTTSMSIPGLHDTFYSHDARGRIELMASGTRRTGFSYDERGNLHTITGPANNTTTFGHDEVGRLTSIEGPDLRTLSFQYDLSGNMTVLTGPSGIVHGFGYNRVNVNTSLDTPLSGSYSYSYDRERRLRSVHFPSGKQIESVYENGRLARIETPEGNLDLSHACGGKVTSISSGAEAITYSYDGPLVVSEAQSGTLSHNLTYTYDNDFRISQMSYADSSVSYGYDADGLLIRSGAFSVQRDAGNGLAHTVSSGPTTLSRTFNGYAELSSQSLAIAGRASCSWSLTRDESGRIMSKREVIDGAVTEFAYTYDPAGRLLTVSRDGTLVESYEYGPGGTRTVEMSLLRAIPSRSLTYSDEDHLLSAGSTTYEYDLDGFITTKTQGSQVTRYTYSSRGELLSVALPDGRLIEYVHDPLGRRIARKVDGVITEKYLWQGMTRLLAVYDADDSLLQRFEYADGRMPAAMIQGGVTFYLAHDQVGSLKLITDAAGSMVKQIDYDSFGNVLSDTNPSFKAPFGFAGGLFDPDTGLVRFGFRDYDPDVGRWTAKDPILFAGGDADLFGYCLSDPVNWIDPFGLWNAQGHADLTTIAAGYFPEFTQADINNMVCANISVDSGVSNHLNDAAHFMPGTRDQAQDLINRLLDRAVELENCGRHEDAMDALGEGLHTVQDRFAHSEQNAGWLEHATGNPDSSTAHPVEYRNALNASAYYFRQFTARAFRQR